MSRARDNADLGAQAGSGLDASDITSGALGASVTGGAGLAVSTATTTALNAKAPLASPDFTGTVDLTGTTVSLDDDEISLDKVNGGTLGTGTIGGSSVVNTSGAITTTGAIAGGSLTMSSASSPTILLTDTTNTVSLKAFSGNTTASVGTTTNHDFILFSNDAERMRIASSGAITTASSITTTSLTANVGSITAYSSDTDTSINTGGAGGSIYLKNTSDTDNNKAGQIMFTAQTGLSISRIVGVADNHSSRYGHIDFMVSSGGYPTSKARLQYDGDWYTNDGSVSSLSDVRIKTDIVDLSDGLDIVNLLKPRTFKFNGLGEMTKDGGEDTTCYGLIADEVLEVASHYVSLAKGKIDGEMVDDLKSLSMTRMIPMLIKAIQELSAKVTALENA